MIYKAPKSQKESGRRLLSKTRNSDWILRVITFCQL